MLVYEDASDELTDEQIDAGFYECFGGAGVSGARLITAWAPGVTPVSTPPDVAYELQAGTRLILQVHYHPTGEPETDDATGVQFALADGVPTFRA